MPLSEPVPHLDDAYRLAQLIANDRTTAADLVLRAYASCGTTRGSRFAVLRAVVASSGMAWRIDPDAPADPFPEPAADPGPAEAFVPESPTEQTVTHGGLLDLLVGRILRDRGLPVAIAALEPRQRIACWLDANGLSNPADAGAVLGLSAGEALTILADGRKAIEAAVVSVAGGLEAAQVRAASAAEPLPDALRRVFDALLERPPATLVDRLAPGTERAPLPAAKTPTRRFTAGSAFRILAFIASAALVGYAIRSFRPAVTPAAHTRSDLVEQAIAVAPGTDLSFRTPSAEQAEVFIRDRIGWRIVVPSVEGSVLEGVGVTVLGSGGEVPVLHFDGARPVVMVVVTYAFLDRVAPRMTVDDSVLDQIVGQGRFSVLDSGPRRATIFRNRDDIFIAVTASDVRDLEQAITFPG